MKKTGLIILLFALTLSAFPQSTEVPFTLEDRDRIMRTEEKVESLRNEMNTKFESIDSTFFQGKPEKKPLCGNLPSGLIRTFIKL